MRLGRLQLQSQLLLNGREQIRLRFGSAREASAVRPGRQVSELSLIGRPLQLEVEPSLQPGLIDHRTIQVGLHDAREFLHGGVPHGPITGPENQVRDGTGGLAPGQLGSVLSHRQRVHRKLLLITMESELKPIRQEFLKHRLKLSWVGPSLALGLPGDIELVRLNPGRCAADLPGMNAIGEDDQVVYRRANSAHLGTPV